MITGFKFEDEGQNRAPRTVQKVTGVDAYLVQYVDATGGEPQVRLAFRVPGHDTTFLMQGRVGNQSPVVPAHKWFHHAFVGKLQELGFEESTEGAKSV
jgi:hypothetical protein